MEDHEIASELYSSGAISYDEYFVYINWDVEDPWAPVHNDENQQIYDKVNTRVENYGEGKDNPPDYDGQDAPTETDVEVKDPSQDNLPPHLNTTGGETSEVAVSTEALKAFSKVLEELETVVGTTFDAVEKVSIKPGAFGAGINLHSVVHGKPGLAGDTLNFLQSVNETFSDLRTDIATLISEYTSQEDWNELTVQQLNNTFNESFGNIDGYGKYGNSNTEGQTGNEDSDDDEDDDNT